MNIKLTSDLVEASIDNSFKAISKYLKLTPNKHNVCEVVNFNEFKTDWLNYIKYISNKNENTKKSSIEAVDMYPYKSIEDYISKHSTGAKNVVILKLLKTSTNDAYKCEEILFKILYEAFGQANVDNSEGAFRLQSDKYVFAGVILSY